MKRAEDIFFAGYPKNKIGILDYLYLFVSCLWMKVAGKRQLTLNLPCEIQYPYIFFNRDNGYTFIKFAEDLGKLTHLKLYWTNCPLDKRIENGACLTVSWDYIPKNINLLINSKLIKKGKNRVKKLLQFRQGMIRFI